MKYDVSAILEQNGISEPSKIEETDDGFRLYYTHYWMQAEHEMLTQERILDFLDAIGRAFYSLKETHQCCYHNDKGFFIVSFVVRTIVN